MRTRTSLAAVAPRHDTLAELRATIARLSAQLSEAQQTIEAIHSGGVDAVVVQTTEGEQVYTLQTADQPYRLMVEQMQQGAAILAADGVVLFVNPLLASLAGSEQRLLGVPFDRVFAACERTAVRAMVAKACGGSVALETRVTAQDGREIPVLLSATPLRSTPAAVAVLVTDLTESRRYEALRATERTFRVLADSSPVPIWMTDADGTFLFVNRAYCEYFATTPEQVTRSGWLPLLHPEDAASFLAGFRKALVDRGLLQLECRVRRGDGEWRWLASYGAPWYSETGAFLGCVGSSPDVSELKHTEQALRQSEERYRLATESMQGVVYDWDVRQATITRSRGLLDLLGHVSETTPSDPTWWLRQLAAEDRERFEARLAAAFAEQSPALDVEYRIRHSDGHELWVWDHGRILYDDEGAPTRLIGCIISVDAQKRLEEALRRADQQKDRFLATLAHELRNPLAPIRNAVAILKAKGPPIPELQWGRDLIDRQVSHMARLLDDLLDVSRITQNKLQLRKERLELRSVLEMALETANPLFEERAHQFSLSAPRTAVYLDADPMRLAQALANLLSNAAKYTDPGGHISLEAEQRDGGIVISIRDSGIGISRETLRTIFQMFSQDPAAVERSEGGLGIGLSLVRGLVELHGGTVEARSEGPGRGSEFVVRLPAAQAPAEGTAALRRPVTAAAAALRVLVADDNRDTAETLAMVLGLQGYDVRTAFDGEEAFAVAQEFRPHVALLDIGMPKANGHTVARRIRAASWGAQVVLIAQTGWGQDDDLRLTQQAGFDHHLVKPVPPNAVTDLLAGLPRPDDLR